MRSLIICSVSWSHDNSESQINKSNSFSSFQRLSVSISLKFRVPDLVSNPDPFPGRNADVVDVTIDHGSASRYHAALVYHKILKRSFILDLKSSKLAAIDAAGFKLKVLSTTM